MTTRFHLIAASGFLSLLPFSIIPSAMPGASGTTELICPEACSSVVAGTEEPDPESAEACAACHQRIYNEWKQPGQMHANAWDDKLYQDKIKKKKRPKGCYGCHIPDRVLARVGRKPKTRKKHLHEGVTCVACHESDGNMHGPFGSKTDAHGTVKDERFTPKGSNAVCNSCHKTKIDVVLPVGKDFEKSGLEAKGKSCIGCHMAEVEAPIANEKGSDKPSGPKRKGRSHKILGPNDAEFCATAFKLSVGKTEGRVVLTIENKAGHRVPGLSIRNFQFIIKQLDADGKTLAEDKAMVDSETSLEVLQSRQVPLKAAKGTTQVEILIQHYFLDKLVADIKKTTLKL
jgi:cytochrome c551/c552